jgi:hypothetical protein
MMRSGKLLASLVAGLALAGCTTDSNTYPASVAELKAKLVGESSTYDTGSQKRSMSVTKVSGNSVSVRLYNNISWSMNCSIDIEAVDDANTRLIPNCGKTGSAIGDTSLGYVETEIAEHAKRILTGEPVDVAYINSKAMARTTANLPAMQGEALKADADMRNIDRQMEAMKREAEAANNGWATQSAGADDGGWGKQ